MVSFPFFHPPFLICTLVLAVKAILSTHFYLFNCHMHFFFFLRKLNVTVISVLSLPPPHSIWCLPFSKSISHFCSFPWGFVVVLSFLLSLRSCYLSLRASEFMLIILAHDGKKKRSASLPSCVLLEAALYLWGEFYEHVCFSRISSLATQRGFHCPSWETGTGEWLVAFTERLGGYSTEVWIRR